MHRLANVNNLFVRQRKEMLEVFTGFETRNRYSVFDENGREIYFAAEVGTGALSRNILKSARPFTIQILDTDGQVVLQLKRPFRWFFHELDVLGADGQRVGAVKRRWSLLRRIYGVYDAGGNELCELFGPILHPWTFRIRQRGVEVGAIRKKWSGLLKEMYTDADNFGVQFPPEADVEFKAVLLGVVFLLDFCHFEDKHG